MRKFSGKYLPNAFVLQNNGVLCYMNSMIQALMSCTAFNQFIYDHRDDFIEKDNNLALTYLNLYDINRTSKKINTCDSSQILLLINRARRKCKDNLFLSRQEDINEGLIFLLDIIGSDIDKLFHSQYRRNIKCLNCKADHIAENPESSESMVDFSDVHPDLRECLITKKAVETFITSNVQVPRDYKCESCGIINTPNSRTKNVDKANILQIYTLAKCSEIIILLLKDVFIEKTERYFPLALELEIDNKIQYYRVVAQIEHYGSASSGHYTCTCLRRKPTHMHMRNRHKIRKFIDRCETKIANMDKSNLSDLSNLTAKIKKAELLLKDEKRLKKEKYGIFTMNDSKISFCRNGFQRDKNTYMVFYHLFEVNQK
jgi:ubiquitin C-terminal hydrolase